MPAAAPLHSRINAKINRSGGPEACWLWTGARDKDGYGIVWVNEQHRGKRAARFILAEALGRQLEPNEFACHTCDCPPCCNPQHLFPGSAALNHEDMARKGRRVKTGPKPKISDEQLLQIRSRLTGRRGEQKELAKEFGVSRSLISLIVKHGHRQPSAT